MNAQFRCCPKSCDPHPHAAARLQGLVVAVLALAIVGLPAAATAQMPSARQRTPYGTYGTAAADPPLQQLIAARHEMREADEAISALTDKYKRKLVGADPVWAGRCREADESAKARDQAREAVLASLMTKPDYAAAQDALAKAQDKMRQLTEARDTASREFQQADDHAYALRNRIREMERTALQSSTEIAAAESRARDARQRMDAYWDRYVLDELDRNPTWTQAVARRDQAAAAARQAEVAFTDSRWQLAAAQVRRTGTGHSGSRSGSRSGRGYSSGSSRSRSR